MHVKIYEYNKCSTCKNALNYLTAKGINFEKVAIVEKPPSIKELKLMLGYLKNKNGSIKNLFNTSGELYRQLNIKDKLNSGMSETDSLKLLSENGKLIKRPFLLTQTSGTVGFKIDEWNKLF
jgi:arsenate reductase